MPSFPFSLLPFPPFPLFVFAATPEREGQRMAIIKDLAQVLRVHEHGNTSLVLVVLGRRSGQLRLLAKGARRWTRKGFAGGFDLLVEGELLAYPRRGEGLWIFKEWDERRRPALGASPALLREAAFLCEFTEALTRETAGSAWAGEEPHWPSAAPAAPSADRHETLYDLLAAAATALAGRAPPGPVLLAFVLRSLDVSGWLPDLARCSACRALLPRGPAPARLGYRGLECSECLGRARTPAQEAPGVWLAPEPLRALDFVRRTGKGVKLSSPAAEALARALAMLVHGALEHDLRTLPAATAAVRDMAGKIERLSH